MSKSDKYISIENELQQDKDKDIYVMILERLDRIIEILGSK